MLKKTTLLGILVLFIYSNSFSQNQTKHEFSVSVSGGVSALKYDADNYVNNQEMGGAFGIGYSYFINNHIGINTGAEISSYNAKATIINSSDRYTLSDENDTFEFRSIVNNHLEKQNAYYINIPLTVQLQSTGNRKFYAIVGAKIGIPMSAKYKTESSKIINTGYYPDINQIFTDQEFRGFGTFVNRKSKNNLDMKVACMLSIETGIKWNLKHTKSLYTGFYIDYGVNNIVKNEETNLISYNVSDPQNFNTNSILSSQYNNNNDRLPFAKKVVPFAIGLRVRMAIGKN